MKGFRFTQYVPPNDPEKNTFDNLLNIFLQLVTMTGGDVAEALSWLTNLDKRYNMTNPNYGIGDFIEDLNNKIKYLNKKIVFDQLYKYTWKKIVISLDQLGS